MKIKKPLIKETVILVAAIIIGAIVAFILGTFGILDDDHSYSRGADESKVTAVVCLPYLLVLSYRLLRLIVRLLKTNPMEKP